MRIREAGAQDPGMVAIRGGIETALGDNKTGEGGQERMFARSRWLRWGVAVVAFSLLLAACAPAATPAPPTPTKAPVVAPTPVPPTATTAPATQPTPTKAPAAAPTPTSAPAPAPTATKAPATGIPAIPHTLEGRADCLLCHKAGGLKPFPANHAGRTNDMCQGCHKPK